MIDQSRYDKLADWAESDARDIHPERGSAGAASQAAAREMLRRAGGRPSVDPQAEPGAHAPAGRCACRALSLIASTSSPPWRSAARVTSCARRSRCTSTPKRRNSAAPRSSPKVSVAAVRLADRPPQVGGQPSGRVREARPPDTERW